MTQLPSLTWLDTQCPASDSARSNRLVKLTSACSPSPSVRSTAGRRSRLTLIRMLGNRDVDRKAFRVVKQGQRVYIADYI